MCWLKKQPNITQM